jgi:DNA helicase-2/ATP-dependent DNA helicase PcrA
MGDCIAVPKESGNSCSLLSLFKERPRAGSIALSNSPAALIEKSLGLEIKASTNVLDYDDLLLYWAQAMSDPLIAQNLGGRFDHVLVDEYQDTNRLQASDTPRLNTDRSRAYRGRR